MYTFAKLLSKVVVDHLVMLQEMATMMLNISRLSFLYCTFFLFSRTHELFPREFIVLGSLLLNNAWSCSICLTLSDRQAGAVSKKMFDGFFLVYWVHLDDICLILGVWFTRCLETSMYHI